MVQNREHFYTRQMQHLFPQPFSNEFYHGVWGGCWSGKSSHSISTSSSSFFCRVKGREISHRFLRTLYDCGAIASEPHGTQRIPPDVCITRKQTNTNLSKRLQKKRNILDFRPKSEFTTEYSELLIVANNKKDFL